MSELAGKNCGAGELFWEKVDSFHYISIYASASLRVFVHPVEKEQLSGAPTSGGWKMKIPRFEFSFLAIALTSLLILFIPISVDAVTTSYERWPVTAIDDPADKNCARGWQPIKDGVEDKIKICISFDPTFKTIRWKLWNTYDKPVTISMDILFEGNKYPDGFMAMNIPPGEARKNGGWWSTGDPTIQSIKIDCLHFGSGDCTSADYKTARERASGNSNSRQPLHAKPTSSSECEALYDYRDHDLFNAWDNAMAHYTINAQSRQELLKLRGELLDDSNWDTSDVALLRSYLAAHLKTTAI